MVSVGVSKLDYTSLIFVKVNQAYYHDLLLSQQLLPAIRQVSDEFFISQQDIAPAHGRARWSTSLSARLLHSSRHIFDRPIIIPTSIQLNIKSEAHNAAANADKNAGCGQFEGVYDWWLVWNATKRYWRCHRPVAQASIACDPEEDISNSHCNSENFC